MINWKEFFQKYRIIEIKNDQDLLYQVAATVKGKPITNEQFHALTNSIKKELQLTDDDRMLDLCCGNGVMTYVFAPVVKEIVGVDISKPYVQNANKYKKAVNISYLLGDVTNLNKLSSELKLNSFNKILLYGSLGYFTPKDLEKILGYLGDLVTPQVRMMIGSILDKTKKWNFFNTWQRKFNYIFKYKLLGIDMGLGRWWTKKEIKTIANKFGYDCRIINQNPILHTAHYRFDCLLTKNPYKIKTL